MDILFLIISYTKGGRISGKDKDERMKNTKQLLVLLITLVIMIPTCIPLYIRANEMLPEEENLSERTGLKSLEVQYLSEEDIPVNYSYEKKVLGSSAYETGENKEWAEYSSYFYYNQMTGPEQSFYDKLMDTCLYYLTEGGNILQASNGGYYLPEVSSDSLDIERALEIYRMFLISNPQFYYLKNEVYYQHQYIGMRVYDAFATESERRKATAQMKTALSAYETEADAKTLEYDKVKAFHDKLCDNVTYNYEAYNKQVSEQESFSQSAYSTFVLNKTVCEGYSTGFAMLCNKIGIDSIVELSGTHAWNRVSVDDIWYVIDCTWDDRDEKNGECCYYKYFLRSYDEVLKNDQKGSHVTSDFLVTYLPFCTMDCTPTNDYKTPGVLPQITEIAAAPKLSVSDGSFTLSAEDGARIYYTLDGSTPMEGQAKSNLYSSAVSVPYGATVKAYAVVDKKKNSKVESWKIEGTETPFSIYPSEAYVIVGGTTFLTIFYTGYHLEGAKEEWSSSDEGIATVEDGLVTGVSTGTALITAKVGDAKAVATVIVEEAPERVDRIVPVGKKITIKASKKVKKVEVSDSSIASVRKKSNKVIIKGKKAGVVYVIAYDKKGKVFGGWTIKVE